MLLRRTSRLLPFVLVVAIAAVFGAAGPAGAQQPTNLGTYTVGQQMSFTLSATWSGQTAVTVQVVETPPGRTLYNGPVSATFTGSTYNAQVQINAQAVEPVGQHTIQATLRNSSGQTVATATGLITVQAPSIQPPPSTVSISCTPNPAQVGQNVNCPPPPVPSGFTSVSVSWNFGDGTSPSPSPSHTYSNPGTFNVSLTRSICSTTNTSACFTQTGQTQMLVHQRPDSFFAIFSGTVTLNGVRAPEGTIVQATIGATTCGQTATVGGNYQIEVLPASSRTGCGVNGALVRFTVDGRPADQAGTFDSTQAQRLDLTAGQASTPTPTPSPSPTATPSPSPSPTATPSPSPTATPSPTASPTASPSPSPTPARTPIPQDVQARAAAQLQTAEYVSGPTTPTVGQTTRVRLVYTITNPLNEPVDYSNTFVAELGPNATIVSVTPTVGANASSGRNAIVGGFVLAPGETQTITILADITPSANLVGGPVAVVTGGRTTGVTASGLSINVPLQPVDSTRINGLQGGFVVTAPVGPVTQPVRTVAPAQSGVLPRTGAGTGDHGNSLPLAVAAATAAAVILPLLAFRRARRGR